MKTSTLPSAINGHIRTSTQVLNGVDKTSASQSGFVGLSRGKQPLLFLTIFLTIYLSFGIELPSSAQSWYNGTWAYRKSHLITGSSGAGTNYQVRVIVHKAIGTDAGANVYLGTNVLDDFADVRFTTSNGTTLLDYWLETGSLTSGTQATFWVEVAADLGSNQTIYIYYGNSGATTASNGANTFTLFDDFTGASLDASKWTKRGGGTPTFAGGLMTVSANSTDPSKIVATGGPQTDNLAIVARFKVTGGTDADERAGVGIHTANTTTPNGYNYVLHNFTAHNEASFLNDGNGWTTGTFTWTTNTNYIMEVFYDGTNTRGRINYGTWSSTAMTGRTGYAALNIGSKTAATTTVWDWAFIRKCLTTEPAHSTWGTEELTPPAITNFLPIGGCQGDAGIVITGTNFTGATAVKFNGVSASYTVDNPTQITATVPLTAITGPISVTTPAGTTTSSTSFTVNALPTTSVDGQSNISCFAGSNGSITIRATGGTGPYNYSVDNGVSWTPASPVLPNPYQYPGLNVANGPYRIKVKDSKGCKSK